jgi:uncharacterized protein YfdQ (DUF2303 family)
MERRRPAMGDINLETEAGQVAELALASVAPLPDGHGSVVLPDGYTIKQFDDEKFNDSPRRKRGAVTVRDLNSLIIYVQRHADDHSIVLLDPDRRTFTAYLNHHAAIGKGNPGWADHLACYQPRFTQAWTDWTGHAEKWLEQETFGLLLETRITEIAEPDGATVLGAAENFRAHINVTFRSGKKLSNGLVQFEYIEEEQVGEFKMPSELTLLLKPFDGGEDVELKAKLDYSLRQGKPPVFRLRLGDAPRYLLDRAFDEMAEKVSAATGVSVLKGTWQAPA